MASRRTTWLMQLVIIAGKGARTRRAGLPRESPYKTADYSGGGLQRQRVRAWLDGWDAEDREIKERGQ